MNSHNVIINDQQLFLKNDVNTDAALELFSRAEEVLVEEAMHPDSDIREMADKSKISLQLERLLHPLFMRMKMTGKDSKNNYDNLVKIVKHWKIESDNDEQNKKLELVRKAILSQLHIVYVDQNLQKLNTLSFRYYNIYQKYHQFTELQKTNFSRDRVDIYALEKKISNKKDEMKNAKGFLVDKHVELLNLHVQLLSKTKNYRDFIANQVPRVNLTLSEMRAKVYSQTDSEDERNKVNIDLEYNEHILSIQEEIKEEKRKIGVELTNLINSIADAKNNIDESMKNFVMLSIPPVSLESESNHKLLKEKYKKTKGDWIESQGRDLVENVGEIIEGEKILEKLMADVSSIENLSVDNLSEELRGQVKILIEMKKSVRVYIDEISTSMTNKGEQLLSDLNARLNEHEKYQRKYNDVLSLSENDDFRIYEKRMRLIEKHLKRENENLVNEGDTEKTIADKIKSENRLLDKDRLNMEHLINNKRRMMDVHSKFEDIEAVKFSNNDKVIFSNEFINKYNGSKDRIARLIKDANDLEEQTSLSIENRQKNITSLQEYKDSLFSSNDLTKLDGDQFKEIKEWIKSNKDYTKMIGRVNKSKKKAPYLSEFENRIDDSRNLNELLQVLSQTYRNQHPEKSLFDNSPINHQDFIPLMSNNDLSTAMRETGSIFGAYSKFKSHKSTTDKHLVALENDFLKHLETKYKLNIKLNADQDLCRKLIDDINTRNNDRLYETDSGTNKMNSINNLTKFVKDNYSSPDEFFDGFKALMIVYLQRRNDNFFSSLTTDIGNDFIDELNKREYSVLRTRLFGDSVGITYEQLALWLQSEPNAVEKATNEINPWHKDDISLTINLFDEADVDFPLQHPDQKRRSYNPFDRMDMNKIRQSSNPIGQDVVKNSTNKPDTFFKSYNPFDEIEEKKDDKKKVTEHKNRVNKTPQKK